MRPPAARHRTGTQAGATASADEAHGAAPAPDGATPDNATSRSERAEALLRDSHGRQAGRLGTGPAGTRAALLSARRARMLIDKLGERLAFERAGMRLYDALLIKCRAADSGLQGSEISLLSYFRDQEAQHFELAASAIEALGGDCTAQTPGADLVGVQGAGLVQAVNDPRASLAQCLRVVFDAELIDNASWELLIRLTRSAGHAALAERFEPALQQEAAHLRTLRDLVARMTLAEAGFGARQR